MDLFDSCPRAYYYGYEENLEKANKEQSQALLYGSMFHEFLEKHHKGLTYEKAVVTEDTPDKQLLILLNEQIDAYIANYPKDKYKVVMVEQPLQPYTIS